MLDKAAASIVEGPDSIIAERNLINSLKNVGSLSLSVAFFIALRSAIPTLPEPALAIDSIVLASESTSPLALPLIRPATKSGSPFIIMR